MTSTKVRDLIVNGLDLTTSPSHHISMGGDGIGDCLNGLDIPSFTIQQEPPSCQPKPRQQDAEECLILGDDFDDPPNNYPLPVHDPPSPSSLPMSCGNIDIKLSATATKQSLRLNEKTYEVSHLNHTY